MNYEEHLPGTLRRAWELAGHQRLGLARWFWLLVERLPHRHRYEILQECAAGGWLIPRYMRLFVDWYEMTPEYAAEQEYFGKRARALRKGEAEASAIWPVASGQ